MKESEPALQKSALPFADLDLARRLELAEGRGSASFVEAHARVDPSVGALFIEVAGTLAMFDGPDSPLTQTFGLGLHDDFGEAAIERLETFFEQRGAGVFHEVCPLVSEETLALLNARGYRPIELTSVLYRALGGPRDRDRQSRSQVEVHRIADGEADLWAETSAEGWSLEAPEFVDFLRAMGRINAERTDSYCFLAEIEGRAVATGLLSIDRRVALLAGASTLPKERRKGAQRALLDARLDFARGAGCDLAMMCARPGSASQRNAEREGFRVAYTRTKWQKSAACAPVS